MSSELIAQRESSRLSLRDLALALLVVLPLAAIIAPYRHIHLDQVFIAGIALIGGLWCLKLALEDVELLLFIFLLYIPFQKVLPGDFGGLAKAVNFTNVFLLLLVLGWLARIAAEKSWTSRPISLIGVMMVLFLGITSVSMAAAALRESGEMSYAIWADLKRWLVPFAVYFIVTATGSSEKTVKRMFLAVIVTTAVIGLLGVKQFWMDMGGGTRQNLEGIRIAVTSGPSNLGALFAYYLPFLLALWLLHLRQLSYWALLFPIVWCLDSLRTTFSRGALVAFMAGALAVIWKKSKLAFVAIALAFALFAQWGGLRLPYSIFGRMTTTYQSDRPGASFGDKLDTSSRTRLTIWEGGLAMMKEHPLFGVGYGRFPRVVGQYEPSVANMDPHNNFLKIGTEMGVPVLAVFCLLLTAAYWRAHRLYKVVEDPMLKAIALGYCGAVVGLVVANLFGSRLESAEISTQFWAMTGGIVILERLERERAARADAEETDGG
ncbi:MAG: O-antigen ligase family protein [Planctomycetota bacterium]|jgi:O-antigen ligase